MSYESITTECPPLDNPGRFGRSLRQHNNNTTTTAPPPLLPLSVSNSCCTTTTTSSCVEYISPITNKNLKNISTTTSSEYILSQHFMPAKEGVPGYPRILLVSRRFVRKRKYINFVGEYHLDLIQRFGGAPVIVPRTLYTIECLEMYMPMDGFMITEGEDIGALYHNDFHQPSLTMMLKYGDHGISDDSKDCLEWELLSRCMARGIPFLGICRGAQMLNLMYKGTLYTDIDSELPHSVKHINYDNYDEHRHAIHVVNGTPLAEWFREERSNHHDGEDKIKIQVNSYHHQGIRDLAPRFHSMAFAEDGLVEAFYDPTHYDPSQGRFCVGLQFHPERMADDYSGCVRLYGEFIEACWNYRAKRTLQTNMRRQSLLL